MNAHQPLLAQHSTQARRLAVELALLDAARRERLLSELPERKRAELQPLLDELLPLVGGAPRDFAADMALAAAQSAPLYDAAHLEELLCGEPPALRRRVLDLFAGGDSAPVAPRVHALIGDWLRRRAAAMPPAPPHAARRRGLRALLRKLRP